MFAFYPKKKNYLAVRMKWSYKLVMEVRWLKELSRISIRSVFIFVQREYFQFFQCWLISLHLSEEQWQMGQMLKMTRISLPNLP